MEAFAKILLTIALVALNAFFVASEFAAVGARRSRLVELARSRALARFAVRVKDGLDLYLSSCQFGITVASIGLGFVAEESLVELLEPLFGDLGFLQSAHVIAVAIALTICTALHVSIGEVAPKNIAIRLPDRILVVVAIPLIVFTFAFYPVIWLLNLAGNAVLRLFGFRSLGRGGGHEPSHSLSEIRMLLEQSVRTGEIKSSSPRLLTSAFNFEELTVRQVMTPRPDVEFLRINQPIASVLEQVRRSSYTRFPLCEDELDSIIGMVHMKDIFNHVISAEGGVAIQNGGVVPALDLRTLRRDIVVVAESAKVPSLLQNFQRGGVHMAAVVDEYGAVKGVVTLEDVLEELVGEIDDEFDERSRPLLREENGVFFALSNIPLHQLAEVLHAPEIEQATVSTLNGFLVERLGHLPRAGDRITVGEWQFEIAKVLSRRLSEVAVRHCSSAGN